MIRAIDAVEGRKMSATLAAKVYQVPYNDLIHLIDPSASNGTNQDSDNSNNQKLNNLSSEDEKILLLYLMRLASMGFSITPKQFRVACKEILVRRYVGASKMIPDLSDDYMNTLYLQNKHFYPNTSPPNSLHAQIRTHFQTLRR